MRTRMTLRLVVAIGAVAALSCAPAHGAIKSKGKIVAVPVNCTGTPDTTKPPDSIYATPTVIPGSGCSGTVSLKARAGKKTLVAGTGKFTLAGGEKGVAKVKLNRKARRALFAMGRLKAKVLLSSPSVVTVPPKVTIKPIQPVK
jgi:hypothetical protein